MAKRKNKKKTMAQAIKTATRKNLLSAGAYDGRLRTRTHEADQEQKNRRLRHNKDYKDI